MSSKPSPTACARCPASGRCAPSASQAPGPSIRVRAGISYALTEAMDEGHCGLPRDELVPLAASLLEVPPELVQTALELELVERSVIADMVGEKSRPVANFCR